MKTKFSNIIAIFAVLLAIVVPAFSGTLTCPDACASGSPCVCQVSSCSAGTLIILDSSKSPVGAPPISSNSVSWNPSKQDQFTLQANCAGVLSNILIVSAGPASSTTTTASGCSCTAYSNAGCSLSPCSTGQMLQARTCAPSGCLSETMCVPSSECSGIPPVNVTPGQLCGNGVCDSGESYLHCCIDCSGCANNYCSATSRTCSAPFDLIIDVPTTIYKGSQFLLQPKQVIDRARNQPIDAYTLCWQASCSGKEIKNLGCNKNVFTIPTDALCVDRLSALLSAGTSLYQYDYSVRYLRQLKLSSSVFPSEFSAKAGDSSADFSLTLQNLDATDLEITVRSFEESVLVEGNYSKTVMIAAGQSARVSIKTPAVPGEYSVSISESSGTGEVQTQKLKVVSAGAGQTGPAAQLSIDESLSFSVEPGGVLDVKATLENIGQSAGQFSIYAKGSAAASATFQIEQPVSLGIGEKTTVPIHIAPSFSSEGEYPLSICASPVGGTEFCLPGTLKISPSTGGLFNFSLSPERVEIGTKDSPVSIAFSVMSRSTKTTQVSPIVNTACPAGVLSGTGFLNSSISLTNGAYQNTFKVSPISRTVSCAVSITLSDSTGSQTKVLDISVAPSFSEISGIADMASSAQTKITQTENEIRKLSSEGRDATSAQVAVTDARTNLAACMGELNKKNFDSAAVVCKTAVDSADSALGTAKYSAVAAGIEAPANSLNVFVIAGVVTLLIGASVLTFGRLF